MTEESKFIVYTGNRIIGPAAPLIITSSFKSDRLLEGHWAILANLSEDYFSHGKAVLTSSPGQPLPAELSIGMVDSELRGLAEADLQIRIAKDDLALQRELYFSEQPLRFQEVADPRSLLIQHCVFASDNRISQLSELRDRCVSDDLDAILGAGIRVRSRVKISREEM